MSVPSLFLKKILKKFEFIFVYNILEIIKLIKLFKNMNNLWNKDIEKKFFTESRTFVSPEQLFYITESDKYFAYWPKNYKGKKSTLQSRNSLIGKFTEKFLSLIKKD